MAVVAAGPDELSGATDDDAGGSAGAAVQRAVHAGADMVELVGAARSGARSGPLRHAGELALLVATLVERHPGLIVAVSTADPRAARLACAAGAGLVNDMTGELGPAVAEAAAEYGTGIICGYPAHGSHPGRSRHPDVVDTVAGHLSRRAEALAERGVPRHNLLIDPRHDQRTDPGQALDLLRGSGRLVATGWPVVATLTGSSFIGDALGIDPGRERPGTIAATVTAATAGIQVFRAHDVGLTRAALDMVDSVTGNQPAHP